VPPGDPQHALTGARDDERRAEAAEAGLLCRQQWLGAEVLVSRAALLIPALGEDPSDLLDRPSVRTSAVAISRASSAGFQNGTLSTSVPSLIRLVACAAATTIWNGA
jgi:hypothetical protein